MVQVVDDSGTPIVGARVVSAPLFRNNTTDEHGRVDLYRFTECPDYKIYAPGFGDVFIDFPTTEGTVIVMSETAQATATEKR